MDILEDISRRGFLKGVGAAAGMGAVGSALAQSSGPSRTYGSKLAAAIKPNIIFTKEVDGNPVVEVEVKTYNDGTINSVRIIKQSGYADWDKAAFKAIVKTEKLPLDNNGLIPPVLVFDMRPKD